MEKRLILNSIKTPDGTVLVSRHVHDYVTYTDKNGEQYMTDGGLDYLRRNITKEPYEELSVNFEDVPFEQAREIIVRGTHGKDRKGKLEYVKLCDMSNEWLKELFQYEMKRTDGKDTWWSNLCIRERSYRLENNIVIEDV